jgi:hypothetical protein
MPSPRDGIISLICGMAEPSRSRRRLLMLQAFIDDSDMSGQGLVAVLAGWIAPAATWLRFVDDWKREVLDPAPAIAVFKPSPSSLKLERERHRLTAALSLIKDHKIDGFATIIPHDAFNAVVRPNMPREMQSPYYWLLVATIFELVDRYEQTGEPIDFVFDHQPGQMSRVMEAWDDVFATMRPEVKRMVPNPPIFRSDAEQLALQPAHLAAWSIRRVVDDEWQNKEPFMFAWPEGVSITYRLWNESHLLQLLGGLRPDP